MAREVWRYVPFEAGSGDFHMAADDYFAEIPNLPYPVFRLYTWNPFAISLGYHQTCDSIRFAKCEKDCIDVVRRPTGGRAILHAEEITYSLILPINHAYAQGGVHTVHNRISEAILLSFQTFGVQLELSKKNINLSRHYRQNIESIACFTSTTEHELKHEGKKVVGSAQKRYSKNILQHGSILLGDMHKDIYRYLNYSEDKLTRFRSIMEKRTGELSVDGVSKAQLESALIEGFSTYFNIEFKRKGLLNSEISDIRSHCAKFRINDHETVH